MFGIAVNSVAAATAGAENALLAVSDTDLVIQNNNFIFTQQYNLLEEMAIGASVQYGRYNIAPWNGRGRPNISAVNRNATPTAPAFWHRYPGGGLALPQNMQLAALLTNNLATGTELEALLWKLASTDWTRNQPPAQYDIILHATATVTPTVNAWKLANTLTFDQAPVGGSYVVRGCYVIGANSIAYRIRFPMRRIYNGTGLHPGGIVFGAYGSLPALFGSEDYLREGVFGFFSSYQVPTLDLYGAAATSTTYDVFLLCGYLGTDTNIANQMANSNY